MLLQHLAERPIRGSRSVREAAAGAAQRFRVLLGKTVPKFAREPRLADTCIAENGHEPRPLLLDGGAVGPAEALKLLIAADERTCKAADATRPHQRECTHEPSRCNPFRFSLHIDRRRLPELKGAPRCGDGAFADQDGARGSSLLQSSSNVDRVAAHKGASRTSLPDDHIAGVHADTQLELLVEQLRKPALHPERDMQRPLGMVFERSRCSECRHHGVARELLNRPAGALDLVCHCVVEALEEDTRAFRILGTRQRRRADQVCEHHSRQLPLLRWPLDGDRRAAARAKLRVTRELCSATVADRHAPIVAHKMHTQSGPRYRGRRDSNRSDERRPDRNMTGLSPAAELPREGCPMEGCRCRAPKSG